MSSTSKRTGGTYIAQTITSTLTNSVGGTIRNSGNMPASGSNESATIRSS
jgi:hypothetical protein